MSRLLVCCVALVTFAGCGGGQPGPQRPSSTASLEIVQPEAGAVVEGPDVHVVVDLQGGLIVPEASTDLAPDTGHIHLKLNGDLVSHTYGTEQLLEGVEPGSYLLEAEFVAADHAPFSPRVLTSTTFEVG